VIIAARIHHKTQFLTCKNPAGGADRTLDLPVLAEKVGYEMAGTAVLTTLAVMAG
jgi:hypothetical protein